jgi:hypothetical protein
MNPYDVFPAMFDIGPEILAWDLARGPRGTEAHLMLETKDKQEQYVLHFEAEAGYWKWIGFRTTDEFLEDRLRKKRVEIENLTVKGRRN